MALDGGHRDAASGHALTGMTGRCIALNAHPPNAAS